MPGLDTPAAFARTGAVPITDIARSYDRNQPIVVINARTGRRQLIWSELDSNATSPAKTTLLIHPAKNLREGERYIVALRRLRGADGALLQPSAAFRRYRDGIRTADRKFERRRPHMERLFKTLKRAGIRRGNLYVAWDFTVASARGLSGRMRHIRDEAFRALGDDDLGDLRVTGASPPFTVDRVTDFTPAENAGVRRRIEGTVEVPCYLDQAGMPARLAVRPRAPRAPDPHARQRPQSQLHLQPPADRVRRPIPRAFRCTAMGCSVVRAR